MSQFRTAATPFIQEETRELFYQRTIVCLWLAVVFFPLFSVLDRFYCPDFFFRFLLWRLVYVVILLTFINLLKIPALKHLAPSLMFASILLGTLVIAMMTAVLGGFTSPYYVGMLLMVAGALSVLPLTAREALLCALSMWLVYMATVLAIIGSPALQQLPQATVNSFFFLCAAVIASIQSYNDLRTLQKQMRAKENILTLRSKLATYTGNLEGLIQQRLDELEETDLKYRDLYENIMDMIVLVDEEGIIRQVNSRCADALGLPPNEILQENIRDFLRHDTLDTDWLTHIKLMLTSGTKIRDILLNLVTPQNTRIEVELSASLVKLENTRYYQLVLRDISATKSIERKLLDTEQQIGASRQATIFGLARLAECRDSDTGQHLTRIRTYSRLLTEELSKSNAYREVINEQFIEEIGYSAILHDIGKVAIPDSILIKPGKLSNEEFERMKEHTILGAGVLTTVDGDSDHLSFLKLAEQIARSHHERWDGTGYPDGLSGIEIPLAARIVSVADVYDALTSSRAYKLPYSHQDSRSIIVGEIGQQFDPEVVNAFLRREEDFKEARMRLVLQQPEIEAG